MLKIFLSSHGKLASGFVSALRILSGENQNLKTFDAYVNDDSLIEALDDFFASCCEGDQKLLLSDLYGGSVNQQMYRYLERQNTFLVTGVNLAFVLELTQMGNVSEEILEKLVQESRKLLCQVRLEQKEMQEDFF